ncbi:MAG TPA: SDR family oxidoreductase [Candidatus Acidoferrales bacterium]|nr:SDR family oxidoreductase [Candidatus Acidoferrales bacterium]
MTLYDYFHSHHPSWGTHDFSRGQSSAGDWRFTRDRRRDRQDVWAGQRGTPLHAHYSATKGGVISFVKALSAEVARYNILVNCIAPGFVDTDILKVSIKDKNQLKGVLAQYPLNRVARPEEVAGPILFAASDLATFITGEVINVNGGSFRCG